MMRDGNSETALDAAARRLDLALAKLESRLNGMVSTAKAEGGGGRGGRGAGQGYRRDPRSARRGYGGLSMAQLTIEVNGRPYLVGCEDGQEPQLRELAKIYDAYVRQLGGEIGQLGETRLFLMGALLMADELQDVRTRLAHTQAELGRLRTERDMLENKAAAALDAAAR